MQPDENTQTTSTSRSNRTVVAMLFGLVACTLALLSIFLTPHGRFEVASEPLKITPQTSREVVTREVVGTSGYGSPTLEPTDTDVLTSIPRGGSELIGQAVTLELPIRQHINDVAFWAGSSDNPLLVVISRDARDGRLRQTGEIAANARAVPPDVGRVAVVSGQIEKIPAAESMASWGLTNAERAQLKDRPIYLKADHVAPVQQALATP